MSENYTSDSNTSDGSNTSDSDTSDNDEGLKLGSGRNSAARRKYSKNKPIEFDFTHGYRKYSGTALAKVHRNRYIYAIANTNEAVEKAFLLPAKEYPEVAGNLNLKPSRAVELGKRAPFTILTVAMVQDGERIITIAEGIDRRNKIRYCSRTGLCKGWPAEKVRQLLSKRRRQARQHSLI
jgi:hypothetical protein